MHPDGLMYFLKFPSLYVRIHLNAKCYKTL